MFRPVDGTAKGQVARAEVSLLDRREFFAASAVLARREPVPSILALQESSRQAAFGQRGLWEEIYDQAQDVARRASALEAVALDPKDLARNVVLGAVLTVAAQGADSALPGDAVVRVPEPVLVEALGRAYEWMGGPGATFAAERVGSWWRLDLRAAPDRGPLPVPELGEPLVRLLVDSQLDGWLDATRPDCPAIYLPAG